MAKITMLLLPALSHARSEAFRAQCLSNVRQISIATLSYVADFHAYPIHYNRYDPSLYWAAKLKPYINARWTDKVFHCPDFKYTNRMASRTLDVDVFYPGRGCYDMNVMGTGTWGLGIGGALLMSGRRGETETITPTRESGIRVPAEMIAIGGDYRCLAAGVTHSCQRGTVNSVNTCMTQLVSMPCRVFFDSELFWAQTGPGSARCQRLRRSIHPTRLCRSAQNRRTQLL